MADERESEERMDLNLYLGPPLSGRRSHDLEGFGTDLLLNSLPFPPSDSPMASPEPPTAPLPAIDSIENSSFWESIFEPLEWPEVAEPEGLHSPSDAPELPAVQTEDVIPERGSADADYSMFNDESVFPQEDPLECPEYRFQRLIESNNRYGPRTTLSAFLYGFEESESEGSPLRDDEQLVRDIVSTPRSSAGKEKAGAKAAGEGLEEEVEEKSNNAANFECNICFDLAKEPVVTSCGHLFCWPCLYQWLHVHSKDNECPMCKGEVDEAKITPIYGRGSSETDVEKPGEDEDLGLKIPPRPRGHRQESFRQQLQEGFLRTFQRRRNATAWSQHRGDLMRSAAAWSQHRGDVMQDNVRFPNSQMPEMLQLSESSIDEVARMVQQLMHEGNPGYGGAANVQDVGQSDYGGRMSAFRNFITTLPLETLESFFTWDELRMLRQTAVQQMHHDLPSNGHGLSHGSIDSNIGGEDDFSEFSINPQIPEPDISRARVAARQASDQASASSTMAVIEGDVAVTAASAEPNSAGSSRPPRRRARSRASSLDAEGMLRDHKRRRTN